MSEIVSFRDFAKGLHTEADPAMIPPGACQDAYNLVFERGSLRVRPGTVRHERILSTGQPIRALTTYQHSSDSLGAARLVAIVGADLYATTEADQTGFEMQKEAAVSLEGKPRLEQFNEWLYIVDGIGPVKRWKPGTWEVLTDYPAPTQAPVVSVDAVEARLDPYYANSYGQDGDANWNGTPNPYYHLDTRNAWHTYNYDYSWDHADIEGICARYISLARGTSIPPSPHGANVVGFEFVANSLSVPITGGADFMVVLPQPEDMSLVEKITISYAVHYGAAWPWTAPAYFGFAEYENGPWAEYEFSCNVTRDTWVTATFDISSVPTQSRDRVRYLRFRFTGLEVQATSREFYHPTWWNFYLKDHPYAVTFLLDGVYVDMLANPVTRGTYEFTYSYDWDAQGDDPEEESPVWQNPTPPPLYKQVVVSDDRTFGFTLQLYKDKDIDASHINVYARGGESADMLRIGRIPLTSASVYTFSWNGRYETTIAVPAGQYVNVPPAGCGLLTGWNGRMVYAKGDTIYISNWDNPRRTPTNIPLPELPTHYGGWFRIGNDGFQITGLGALGSYLGICKRRGVWRLEGTGPDDWVLRQVADTIGCESQETIAQIEGNALAWLGRDTVIRWDGQYFGALGAAGPTLHNCPVSGILKRFRQTYGEEAYANAFAVYDDTARRYMLLLPVTRYNLWVPNRQGTVSRIDVKTGTEVARYWVAPHPSYDIAGIERSSNVVTVTTEQPHPFSVDTRVDVEGVNPSSFNGTGFIITAVPTSTTFRYTQTGANETGSGGTVSASSRPSRTTVDHRGGCWVGLRQRGTVVKIGVPEAGAWEDRNSDGTCQTSADADGDGHISGGEMLAWGEDEAVLLEVVLVEGYEGAYAPGTYTGPYDYSYWGTAPRGIGIDLNGYVWVSSWSRQKYWKLHPDTGAFLQTVDVSIDGHKPYGAIIDNAGLLWSSSYNSGAFLVYFSTEEAEPTVDTVSTPGQYPYGLAFDGHDHLFFTYWGTNHGVARLDLATKSVDWNVDIGAGPETQVRGVCVSYDGDVWVAVTLMDKVVRYSHNGTLKAEITDEDNIYRPTGVATDQMGRIWVLNGNETVAMIDPNLDEVTAVVTLNDSQSHYGYSDMFSAAGYDTSGSGEPVPEPCAEALVFEASIDAWTRWIRLPGGAGVYAKEATIPGTYLGTRQCARWYADVIRAQEGTVDAGAYTTSQPIPWKWHSREVFAPDATEYKNVDRVTAIAAIKSPAEEIAMTLHANGNPNPDATRTISVLTRPGQTGEAVWRPPLLADMKSFAVSVSGASTTEDELLVVEAEVTRTGT